MDGITGSWIKIGNIEAKAKHCLLNHDLGLSYREIETIFHLSRGLPSTEIARKMGVSPNTITTYKTRIFNKLGVNTTVEALVIVVAVVAGAEVKIGGVHYLAAA